MLYIFSFLGLITVVLITFVLISRECVSLILCITKNTWNNMLYIWITWPASQTQKVYLTNATRLSNMIINWLDNVGACLLPFTWSFTWPAHPSPNCLQLPFLENYPQLTRLSLEVLPPSLPPSLLHSVCSQWLINMEKQKANPILDVRPVLWCGSC